MKAHTALDNTISISFVVVTVSVIIDSKSGKASLLPLHPIYHLPTIRNVWFGSATVTVGDWKMEADGCWEPRSQIEFRDAYRIIRVRKRTCP